MGTNKQRLTITVDPELLTAGQAAVDSGAASSMSSWIGEAIQAKVSNDQKLASLAAAIADFEAEHGEITNEEIVKQQRHDRTQATVVRNTPKSA